MHYYKGGKVKKIFFNSQNDVPINAINYVSKNEIWYSTFGSGVLLQDVGTFKNFYSKDGFDPKGMVLVSSSGTKKYVPKNGLFVFKNKIKQPHKK